MMFFFGIVFPSDYVLNVLFVRHVYSKKAFSLTAVDVKVYSGIISPFKIELFD